MDDPKSTLKMLKAVEKARKALSSDKETLIQFENIIDDYLEVELTR